jgi:hypothetical protein
MLTVGEFVPASAAEACTNAAPRPPAHTSYVSVCIRHTSAYACACVPMLPPVHLRARHTSAYAYVTRQRMPVLSYHQSRNANRGYVRLLIR